VVGITKNHAKYLLSLLDSELGDPEKVLLLNGHTFIKRNRFVYEDRKVDKFNFTDVVHSGIYWIRQERDRMGGDIFPNRMQLDDHSEIVQCKGVENEKALTKEMMTACTRTDLLVDVTLLEEIAAGKKHPRVNSAPKKNTLTR
jgi:hypothetical protein